MKALIAFVALLLSIEAFAQPATAPATSPTTGPTTRGARTRFPRPDVRYEYTEDSKQHDGVPRGKIIEFSYTTCTTFPGTNRKIGIYIPAQYDGTKPACLMVFQDGVRHYLYDEQEFKTATVLDNLIFKKEIPVIIGLYLDPGYKKPIPAEREKSSTAENRSFEYDTLSTQYSDFVINEILPYVKKEYKLNITDDPNGRAIGGMSSGAICAFTVAWNHPEQFGKVFSHVGSFTNIRGGHQYPAMIREADWKPMRVFLQDNASDNRGRNPERNWVIANHNMAAAFEEKDYDYKYVMGEGGHNGNFGGTIFPDTLRWLWRDYPKD